MYDVQRSETCGTGERKRLTCAMNAVSVSIVIVPSRTERLPSVRMRCVEIL